MYLPMYIPMYKFVDGKITIVVLHLPKTRGAISRLSFWKVSPACPASRPDVMNLGVWTRLCNPQKNNKCENDSMRLRSHCNQVVYKKRIIEIKEAKEEERHKGSMILPPPSQKMR
jgi:hypothetical protein